MIFNLQNSVNQAVKLSSEYEVELHIKREDAIHPMISGNKYRKLKYNIAFAEENGFKTLLTFGGAYSNHIAATAAAGAVFGFKTIGVIRGEELASKIEGNATLRYARHCGMQFKFINRSDFRNKTAERFIEDLKTEFGDFYHIPEGGTNELAVKGSEEILTEADKDFDFICSSAGTGGTLAGLINSAGPHQKVLGFSALRGDFLKADISKFTRQDHWELITDYHFGGYAKINTELIAFINQFNKNYDIPLDPVYTGKMLFGVVNMIENGYFAKGSRILAIHTGGLQGISGMNARLKQKKMPLILSN